MQILRFRTFPISSLSLLNSIATTSKPFTPPNFAAKTSRSTVTSRSIVTASALNSHPPSVKKDEDVAAGVVIEPRYLSCSVPDERRELRRRLKVAVLVSGGVDSSVALRLLHAAGHRCTAFYLKIWFQYISHLLPIDRNDDVYTYRPEMWWSLVSKYRSDQSRSRKKLTFELTDSSWEDFENFWTECPWEDDLKYAKAVCDQVDVPLEVVHLTDEYWQNVVSYIIEEYKCGRTPNPDVLCNTRIKFGAFMDAISNMDFDYVASGHYAKVVHPCMDEMDKPSVLELSMDMVKDQTYFLSHLSQDQLKRLLFPLGCIPKNEVRKLATMFDLPNKDRKDSQGICFLGKIKFSEFVARHIGEMEGIILEAETGDFLGKHNGFWFYTIGQRQGLRLPGGPWYVVLKDVKNNVVFVSRNYFSIDKKRRSFRVGSLKWLNGMHPDQTSQLRCKVRHGPSFYSCKLTIDQSEDPREDIATVSLSQDDQGLAAGQFAAFYQDQTCIGSGVILESWDEETSSVSSKALEIANMEDRSKLGKPVRIMVKPEIVNDSDNKDDKEINRLLVKSTRRLTFRETVLKFSLGPFRKIRNKCSQFF